MLRRREKQGDREAKSLPSINVGALDFVLSSLTKATYLKRNSINSLRISNQDHNDRSKFAPQLVYLREGCMGGGGCPQ
jgi:hypothetical protein